MSVERLTNKCTCDYCLFARYGQDVFIASMDDGHRVIDRSTKHSEGSADDYGTLVFIRRRSSIVEVDVGGRSQSFGYKGDSARVETRIAVGTIFGPSTDIS